MKTETSLKPIRLKTETELDPSSQVNFLNLFISSKLKTEAK